MLLDPKDARPNGRIAGFLLIKAHSLAPMKHYEWRLQDLSCDIIVCIVESTDNLSLTRPWLNDWLMIICINIITITVTITLYGCWNWASYTTLQMTLLMQIDHQSINLNATTRFLIQQQQQEQTKIIVYCCLVAHNYLELLLSSLRPIYFDANC